MPSSTSLSSCQTQVQLSFTHTSSTSYIRVPTMHHWILLACHYFSGLTVRSPIGFELDMMLPPSQLEMPSHQEKGMTTSITLDPSNLASISLYLPSFIAGLSLATTLARIATLPLDCAIVTRPGENRRQNLPYLVCDVVPFPSKHLKGRSTEMERGENGLLILFSPMCTRCDQRPRIS